MALNEPFGESPSSRGALLQRFQDLHEYMCMLGEHVNQIHSNLDRIEKNIGEMRNAHASTVESNKAEIKQIHSLIVAKAEVEGLLQELDDIIKGAFPTLPEIPEQTVED